MRFTLIHRHLIRVNSGLLVVDSTTPKYVAYFKYDIYFKLNIESVDEFELMNLVSVYR